MVIYTCQVQLEVVPNCRAVNAKKVAQAANCFDGGISPSYISMIATAVGAGSVPTFLRGITEEPRSKGDLEYSTAADQCKLVY